MLFQTQLRRDDCGVACIISMLNICGVHLSYKDIDREIEVDENGLSLYEIKEYLCLKGIPCQVYNVKNPFKIDDSITPTIIYLRNYKNKGLSHYVLLYKVKKKKCYVFDPAEGKKKKYRIDDLEKQGWKYCIVLNKKNYTMKSLPRYRNSEYPSVETKYILLSIVISVILALLGAWYSGLYKILYEDCLTKSKFCILYPNLFIACFAIIIQTILAFLDSEIKRRASFNLEKSFSEQIQCKILQAPYEFVINRDTGDLLNLFQDGYKLKEFSIYLYIELVFDLLVVVGLGGMLFKKNTEASLIMITCVGFCVLIQYLIKKKYCMYKELQINSVSDLNENIIQSVKNIETIKTYGMINREISRFNEINTQALNVSMIIDRIETIKDSINGMIVQIGFLFILFELGVQIVNKNETFGGAVSFMVLLSFVIPSIERLANFYLLIQGIKVSKERYNTLISYSEKSDEKLWTITDSFSINFENVYYIKNNRRILINVSFAIKNGEHICITGSTGSGKSTLVRILIGLIDPSRGRAFWKTINGKRNINCKVSDIISYLPQNVVVFKGTVLENIVYGEKIIDLDKIYRILSLVGYKGDIYRFINSENISGGEKQKICLARALYSEKQVYILDEPLKSLDWQSKKYFLEHFHELYKDKTLIVVSHEINELDKFDRVLELKDGILIS